MVLMPFPRVVTYFVLLQQFLINVKSLSRNYLRFQSKLLSTVNDSPPALTIVGEKPLLEKTKFDTRNIEFTVVNSAILSFAPWLELHHIVVLKDKSVPDGGAYTIDFSPMNQTSPFTLIKMLLGQSVQGVVRTRYIPEQFLNSNEVKNNIFCNDLHCFFVEPLKKPRFLFSYNNEQQLEEDSGDSDYLFPIAVAGSKRSLAVEDLLFQIKSKWKPTMNLYLRNCQHFSGFARGVFKENK